jgi:serine/threonine-protein kinase
MPFEVSPGEVLAGKYAIEAVLGRGGMGLVLAARHLQLDERVAIKLMLPEVATNADAVARFVREARAAAKIRSEHVVRVSDVGTLEGGQPFMVMEYLEGSDLAALLASRGPLPLPEVAEYVLQACEAISEAHALGIVHRDLKPSNLYLTQRVDGTPVVKVLDFGISKVSASTNTLTAGTPSRTQTSALMGSPFYMSPEQMASSRDVDARSDVWALGIIIYELLSGAPPFMGQTLPEVCARILEGTLEPLRNKVPDLPEAVEVLVGRCLVRDLGARFRDVGELSRALVPFAPKRARVSVDRISAVLGTTGTFVRAPSSADPVASPGVNRATEAAWAESRPPARPKTSRFVGAGVGLVALAAVVGYAVFGRNTRAEPTVAASTRQEASMSGTQAAVIAKAPSAEPPATASTDRPPQFVPLPEEKPSASEEKPSASATNKPDAPAPTVPHPVLTPHPSHASTSTQAAKPFSPETRPATAPASAPAPKASVAAATGSTTALKAKAPLTYGGRL